jgi:hypothetical protein
MFRKQRRNEGLWLLASRLLLLAVWSNAIAGIVCPHIGASSRECFVSHSVSRFHESEILDAKRPEHTHCGGSEMSDADSDSALIEPGTSILPGSDNIQLASTESFPVTAATQQNEQCSHCMMHSQPWASSPLRSVLLNNSAYQIAPATFSIPVVVTFQSLTAIDVHDHGPPGFSSPRYVLNSTFRI